MSVYCPFCRKEVDYNIEKREINEFRGVKINTYENTAVCKECHKDLYVNEIEEKIMKEYMNHIEKKQI